MLTIGVSSLQCILVTAIAARCVEHIVALSRAHIGDGDEGRSRPQVADACNTVCEAERLALDRRGVQCRMLGETMGGITTPMRRELVLVSSVVC